MGKQCISCGAEKPITEFYVYRPGNHRNQCKSCVNAYQRSRYSANIKKSRERSRIHSREWRKQNPEKTMFMEAKKRSLEKKIECTITPCDIVIEERCPICNVILQQGHGSKIESSPTLDRINPNYGYVANNIAVICWECNRIKNDASANRHLQIGTWMLSKLN